MTGPQNVCRNCKWAQWEMTAHKQPRPNPNKPGKCRYPLGRIALPVIMDQMVGEHPTRSIWTDEDRSCRVWEKA